MVELINSVSVLENVVPNNTRNKNSSESMLKHRNSRNVLNLLLRKALIGAFFYSFTCCSLTASTILQTDKESCIEPTKGIQASVSQVLNGDTFRLVDGRIVKLLGIEAPEYNFREPGYSENGAQQAFQYLSQLLPPNTTITFFTDKKKQDRYGHQLAFVRRNKDRVDINAQVLKKGWARQIIHPPNEKYWSCYQDLEKSAKKEALGLWQYLRYWPRITKFVAKSDAGYLRLQGEITAMENSRRYLTLILDDKISLGIKLDDLHYFSDGFELKLLHKKVDIRGWLYFSHEKLRMRIRHPQQINLLQP